MDIITEYVKQKGLGEEVASKAIVIVRTIRHTSNLAHLLNLLRRARKDFPGLKPSEVEVMHYAGRSYKGTYGIEFSQPLEKIPAGYKEIHQVERALV